MAFFVLLTSVLFFLLSSSSAVVSGHLMKEPMLNKDTCLETEWAGHVKGHQRGSGVLCGLDGCECLRSVPRVAGLEKTLPSYRQISHPGPRPSHKQCVNGRPSPTKEAMARRGLQLRAVQ